MPEGKVCRKPGPFQLKNLPSTDSSSIQTYLIPVQEQCHLKQWRNRSMPRYCPINQKQTLETKWLLMPSGTNNYLSLNNRSQNSTVAYQKAYAVPDTWCCRQIFRREVNVFPLEIWEKLTTLNELKQGEGDTGDDTLLPQQDRGDFTA